MSEIELRPEETPQPALAGLGLPRRAAWRPIWAILHDATDGLFRHDGVMVASAIAFSLIFALFPFVDLPGGARRDLRRRRPFRLYQPRGARRPAGARDPDAGAGAEPHLRRRPGSASPLTFGLLVTLISITGAVEAIRDGLNRAYGCAEDRHLIRRYLSSLFFVFVGMAFLLVVAALGIAVPIGIDIPAPLFSRAALRGRLAGDRPRRRCSSSSPPRCCSPSTCSCRRGGGGSKSVVGGVLLTLVAWWLAGKVFGFYITEIRQLQRHLCRPRRHRDPDVLPLHPGADLPLRRGGEPLDRRFPRRRALPEGRVA